MSAPTMPLERVTIPADLTPEALERASEASSAEGGGEVLSDALNQMTILWDAISSAKDEDAYHLLIARTVADVGMRLRQDAIALGLVEEDEGLHVQPGRVQYDLNNAVYVLQQCVRNRSPITDGADQARYDVVQAFENAVSDFEFTTGVERTLFDRLDGADIESVEKYAIAEAGVRLNRAARQMLARVQELLLREMPAPAGAGGTA